MAQHGQPTEDIIDLILCLARCIPGCLEIVEEAGLLRGVEFKDDLVKRDLFASGYLQVYVENLKECALRCGSNTRHPNAIPPGNRSLTRDNSTTVNKTEVFPIPPGPRMQTREISSFVNSWTICSPARGRCGASEASVVVFDDLGQDLLYILHIFGHLLDDAMNLL